MNTLEIRDVCKPGVLEKVSNVHAYEPVFTAFELPPDIVGVVQKLKKYLILLLISPCFSFHLFTLFFLVLKPCSFSPQEQIKVMTGVNFIDYNIYMKKICILNGKRFLRCIQIIMRIFSNIFNKNSELYTEKPI